MLRLPSPGLPATELPASDEGHSQFPQEPQGGDGSGSGDEGDEGEGVFWDSTMGFGEPCSPPQIWGPGRIFLSFFLSILAKQIQEFWCMEAWNALQLRISPYKNPGDLSQSNRISWGSSCIPRVSGFD